MASPAFQILNGPIAASSTTPTANAIIKSFASNELIFAVVGHVGSGTSQIANALQEALTDEQLAGGAFEAHVIKARSVLVKWAVDNDFSLPPATDKSMEATEKLQDCGDAMRAARGGKSADHAAVARGLIKLIIETRDESSQKALQVNGIELQSLPKRKAYILDALRHPAEVHLLRRLYDDAFVLIGVACEEGVRESRLLRKFTDAGKKRAFDFMQRDAKAKDKHGQRVADTFHLADYFLDNTVTRGESTRGWDVIDRLGRLVRIVAHAGVTRPEVDETAMHHAYAAMMQSACLSRQVGAALIDADGALLSTGTNEVPKGGGGVYGEPLRQSAVSDIKKQVLESRCALRGNGPHDRFCSNTREQNSLIENLLEVVLKGKIVSDHEKESLLASFRETRVGGLLEFSRAVHAEMDALLTAGRTGSSTISTRLFVTTFPCHYCARHIVSAGVDEVQYIEPYPKSLALKLHNDSICVVAESWTPPSRGGATVLFRPFSGVAPRFYRRAFLKDRELKNESTGNYLESTPEWGTPYYLSKVDYRQMEQELVRDE